MSYVQCLVCNECDDNCECEIVRRARWEAAKSAWINLRSLVASADLDILFFFGLTIGAGVTVPPASGGDTGSESIS